MPISRKALIQMGKWKMLLISLPEGEHTFKVLTRNQTESLRQTITRTKTDRPDSDFVYESCYRGTVFVVKKTRKRHGESIEQ